ncbi:P-loop containing nucleoside triphosphate hydrolase protein [Cladochytrium replicatum]|nr:P-loop containing nucleoside triphosphate hydrolase protein [Cladochytrium replicatum]
MPPKKSQLKGKGPQGPKKDPKAILAMYATSSQPKKVEPEPEPEELPPPPPPPSTAPAGQNSPSVPSAQETNPNASVAWDEEEEKVIQMGSLPSNALSKIDADIARDESIVKGYLQQSGAKASAVPVMLGRVWDSATENVVWETLKRCGVIDQKNWLEGDIAENGKSIQPSSLDKLNVNLATLERLGFTRADCERGMAETCSQNIATVIEWLCLNLPTGALPAGFAENIIHQNEELKPRETKTVRTAFESVNTDVIDQSAPIENVSQLLSAPTTEDFDAKSWILRQTQSESDEDSHNEDSPPTETTSDDAALSFAQRHAILRMELDELRSDRQQLTFAKKGKGANAPKGTGIGGFNVDARIDEVLAAIRALERRVGFDQMEANEEFRQLKAAKKKNKTIEAEVPQRQRDELPVAGGTDADCKPEVEAVIALSEGVDGEGEMEGLSSLFTEPADPVASDGSVISYLDCIMPTSWTGKTPKQTLHDWLTKVSIGAAQAKRGPILSKRVDGWRVSYHKAQNEGQGTGNRADVWIEGLTEAVGPAVQGAELCRMEGSRICISVPQTDIFRRMKDAEEYVAVRALFLILSNMPLYRQLPGPHRDYWLAMAAEEKRIEDAVKREEDRKRAKFLLELIEARDLKIKELKRQKKSVESTELVTEEKNAGNQNRGQTDTVSGLGLKEDFELRSKESYYQKILADRKSLPVYAMREQVLNAIHDHQVVVISGETGSGKSTQIPQFVIEEAILNGVGDRCKVICAQPRRISATSIASRVSEEMGDGIDKVGATGSLVGYQIRLEAKVTKSTRLMFCTTGILLRRLEIDPTLGEFTTIVIDEVHERQLDSDFLLLLLRRLLSTIRPDLKIILMSATAEAEKFIKYFDGVGPTPPIWVQVSGRTYPVTAYYMEDAVELSGYSIEPGSEYAFRDFSVSRAANVNVSGKGGKLTRTRITWDEQQRFYTDEEFDTNVSENINRSADTTETKPADGQYSKRTLRTLDQLDYTKINMDLIEQILHHLDRSEPVVNKSAGSVLIFLPGLGEIRGLFERLDAADMSRAGVPRKWFLIPLHSVLGSSEQSKVFSPAPNGLRKVVLSTNIAETGITIPDVVCVIDTCRAREINYDERRNVTRLADVLISKANCAQRRGRAGRVRPGKCFHLIAKDDFARLAAQRPPEILRLPLEELCLRARTVIDATSSISTEKSDDGSKVTISELLAEALDSPPQKNIDRALEVLHQIGAFDNKESLTQLGSALAALPVDVRLGKVLLYGIALRCLDPLLTIAASLSLGKSPFVRPFGKSSDAEKAKLGFLTANSDLLTIAHAYDRWRNEVNRQIMNGHTSRWSTSIRTFCDRSYLSIQNLHLIEDTREQLLRQIVWSGMLGNETNSEQDPLRRQGKRVLSTVTSLPSLNTFSSTPHVTLSALGAGLFPNLLHSPEFTTASMRTIMTSGGEGVSVHPRSLIALSPGNPKTTGWFSYHTMMRGSGGAPGSAGSGGKLQAHDLNPISFVAVVGLCINDLSVQPRQRLIVAGGGRFKVVCAPRTAALLRLLAVEVQRIIGDRLAASTAQNGNTTLRNSRRQRRSGRLEVEKGLDSQESVSKTDEEILQLFLDVVSRSDGRKFAIRS